MWGDPEKRDTRNYGSTQPRYNTVPTVPSPSRGANPRQQFHQLSDSISSCIFAVSSATGLLEHNIKQLGTQVDNEAFRDTIHATQQSTNDTIKAAASQLSTLSTLASSGDKQLKLQSERLNNQFQDVVKRYSTIQKQVATRQKYTMALPAPQPEASSSWGGEENQPLIVPDESHIQAQKQIIADLDYENAMLMEREDRIRLIEADVLDINEIFKNLATHVHDQGGVIDTIASNIETAEYNTAEGVDQLRSASQYQTKARKKMCCLAITVAVGAVVLALVIYFTVK